MSVVKAVLGATWSAPAHAATNSEATQGAEESGRVHAFDRLLGATAARDVPDGFHLLAAHHVDAVVEVDGGIAVRREELDELAEGGQPSRLRYGEAPVLVARPGVGDSGTLERLGHERLVGGEGLEPTVDHGHLLGRHADDGGEHGEGHLEVVVVAAALTPDTPIVEVHHAVGAALQLGQTLELGVDVEGAGGAPAHDLDGEAEIG